MHHHEKGLLKRVFNLIGFAQKLFQHIFDLLWYRQRTINAFADIDVQLKQRYDLIPQLVETVKGYAKHEQETLSQVIAMRNQLTNMGSDASVQEKMDVSNQLSGTLKTIFALSESYPDLKANTNFIKLQEELTNTEKRNNS